ncbi:hypothetical protein CWI36_2354p0010, partial [Hamiltosporidium magnivora]
IFQIDLWSSMVLQKIKVLRSILYVLDMLKSDTYNSMFYIICLDLNDFIKCIDAFSGYSATFCMS